MVSEPQLIRPSPPPNRHNKGFTRTLKYKKGYDERQTADVIGEWFKAVQKGDVGRAATLTCLRERFKPNVKCRNKLRVELEIKRMKIAALQNEGKLTAARNHQSNITSVAKLETTARIEINDDETWSNQYLKRIMNYEFYSTTWRSEIAITTFESSLRQEYSNNALYHQFSIFKVINIFNESCRRHNIIQSEIDNRSIFTFGCKHGVKYISSIKIQRWFVSMSVRKKFLTQQLIKQHGTLRRAESINRTSYRIIQLLDRHQLSVMQCESYQRSAILHSERLNVDSWFENQLVFVRRTQLSMQSYETRQRSLIISQYCSVYCSLLELSFCHIRHTLLILFMQSSIDRKRRFVLDKWYLFRKSKTIPSAISIQRWWRETQLGEQGRSWSKKQVRRGLDELPEEIKIAKRNRKTRSQRKEAQREREIARREILFQEWLSSSEIQIKIKIIITSESSSRQSEIEIESWTRSELMRNTIFFHHELLYRDRQIIDTGWEGTRGLIISDEEMSFERVCEYHSLCLMDELISRNNILSQFEDSLNSIYKTYNDDHYLILINKASITLTKAFRIVLSKISFSKKFIATQYYITHLVREETLRDQFSIEQANLLKLESNNRVSENKSMLLSLHGLSEKCSRNYENILMRYAEERAALKTWVSDDEQHGRNGIAKLCLDGLCQLSRIENHESRKKIITQQVLKRSYIEVEENTCRIMIDSIPDIPTDLRSISSAESIQRWWIRLQCDREGHSFSMRILRQFVKKHRSHLVVKQSQADSSLSDTDLQLKLQISRDKIRNSTINTSPIIVSESMARICLQNDITQERYTKGLFLHGLLVERLKPMFKTFIKNEIKQRGDIKTSEVADRHDLVELAFKKLGSLIRHTSVMVMQRLWRVYTSRHTLFLKRRYKKCILSSMIDEQKQRTEISLTAEHIYNTKPFMTCGHYEVLARRAVIYRFVTALTAEYPIFETLNRNSLVRQAVSVWISITKDCNREKRKFGVRNLAHSQQQSALLDTYMKEKNDLEIGEKNSRRRLRTNFINKHADYIRKVILVQSISRRFIAMAITIPRQFRARLLKIEAEEDITRRVLGYKHDHQVFGSYVNLKKMEIELSQISVFEKLFQAYLSETDRRFGDVFNDKKISDQKECDDYFKNVSQQKVILFRRAVSLSSSIWDTSCVASQLLLLSDESDEFILFTSLCHYLTQRTSVELEFDSYFRFYISNAWRLSIMRTHEDLESDIRFSISKKETTTLGQLELCYRKESKLVRLSAERQYAETQLFITVTMENTILNEEQNREEVLTSEMEYLTEYVIACKKQIKRIQNEENDREKIIEEQLCSWEELLIPVFAQIDEIKEILIKQERQAQEEEQSRLNAVKLHSQKIAAAIIFQKNWRGRQGRRSHHQIVRKQCSCCIQRFIRCVFSRCILKNLKRNRFHQYNQRERSELENYSATLIQSCNKMARCRLNSLFEADEC